MHALIVVSHPLDTSLTHGVAAAIAEGITAAEPAHTFEIADLPRKVSIRCTVPLISPHF